MDFEAHWRERERERERESRMLTDGLTGWLAMYRFSGLCSGFTKVKLKSTPVSQLNQPMEIINRMLLHNHHALKKMQVYKGGNSIEYYWLLVAMWCGCVKKNN